MSVSLLVDIASGALLLLGGLLLLSGSIGLLRFPDFYTRTHAASLTDAAGGSLLILGLLLQVTGWQSAVRLLLILAFMMLTGPTSTHALAQAARRDGEPIPTEGESRP